MLTQTDDVIQFSFRARAQQVYLLLRPAARAGWSLHAMEQTGPASWALRLGLRPGRYRVRYYVNDGRLLTFSDPTEPPGVGATAAGFSGMDTVVVVPRPPGGTPSVESPQPAALLTLAFCASGNGRACSEKSAGAAAAAEGKRQPDGPTSSCGGARHGAVRTAAPNLRA